MPGPDPRTTNLKPNDPKSKKYMDKKTGNKINFKDDDIPTRLQKTETTIDKIKMAKGGRAMYRVGGLARRKRGCA